MIDIRYNITSAEQFILSLDLAAFKLDLKTFYATTRALEIISEASRRVSEELKNLVILKLRGRTCEAPVIAIDTNTTTSRPLSSGRRYARAYLAS